jgi:hypothetical protein
MYSTAHYEDFKSSENLGNLRLNFLHLAVNDRGESIIRHFKYEELYEYSKKFKIILGMSVGTRKRLLMKKNEAKKYCWNVRLNTHIIEEITYEILQKKKLEEKFHNYIIT